MARYGIPMLACDGYDGFCVSTESDYYGQMADSVDGVRITAVERAPGWVSTDDEDYCPEHSTERNER